MIEINVDKKNKQKINLIESSSNGLTYRHLKYTNKRHPQAISFRLNLFEYVS